MLWIASARAILKPALRWGWAWPAAERLLTQQEATRHLSERLKPPLVCPVAPMIYLLLPARNGDVILVESSVHHFPLIST